MPWPKDIVTGYFWYGRKYHSPGRPPRWLNQLADDNAVENVDGDEDADATDDVPPLSESDVRDADADMGSPTDPNSVDPPQPESNRSHTSRYSLRRQTNPPGRFM